MFEIETIKDKIFSELERWRTNKKVVYHTGILFLSQALVIILGFITKGIQTRALSPENYGLYAFFTTVTGFGVLFFNLGLYPTIETMLAGINDKQKEKELFGTSFIITFFLGILFSAFLFALSYIIDKIFHMEFGYILRLISPMCIIFPFRLLIPALAIGSNKITHAAWYDVLFQLLFSVLLFFMFMYFDLTIKKTILLNLFSSVVAVSCIVYFFRPSFINFYSNVKEIWIKNKEYGIHYYLGSIFSETTYRLDELFITYFINTTQLGFYSLANIICSPMVMFSSALSSALFKRFASVNYVSKKIFFINAIWIIISSTVLYLFSGFIVKIFFGAGFETVTLYIIPLSLSYIFKTLCQPFAFLAAKGKGKEIRNVAFAEGIFSVITNIIFIPMWGVMGAIYSSILVRAVDFVGLYYYYRKYIAELRTAQSEI